jgi:predicted RNA-binding Zn ribbon-like protein
MAAQKKSSPRRTPDFLWLSGHPALDFINTRPVLRGHPVELLSDYSAVLRWFVAARLLASNSASTLEKRWAKTAGAPAVHKQLLLFREQLRHAIESLESGKPLPAKMFADLNRLLAQHPLSAQVVSVAGTLQKQPRFEPHKPADLFAPIVNAAADLFATLDPHRLRQCESCVLHFHDTTKNATRRWCSMKFCGNRAKVAAYAARQRSQFAPTT